MWMNSSFSKRCRNSRARARITGSAGISCGCGKRSSMYSLMMFDSCSTRSRSTSTGTWLYGFITARSSGLWSRSTSMIWKSMPFLVQHDAAALAERVGRAGIKGHHGRDLPDRCKACAARDCKRRATIAGKLWGRRIAAWRTALESRIGQGIAAGRCDRRCPGAGVSARPSSIRASSSTRRRTARRETAARRCRGGCARCATGSAM